MNDVKVKVTRNGDRKYFSMYFKDPLSWTVAACRGGSIVHIWTEAVGCRFPQATQPHVHTPWAGCL